MLNDRDYMRGGGNNFTGSFFNSKKSNKPWSAIKILIVVNIVCFFLQNILVREQLPMWYQSYFTNFMAMVPVDVFSGKVWKIFTSMFVHGSFLHLFFNLFALWSFGSSVENYLGRRKFFQLYFFSGLVGALCYLFSEMNSIVPCLGASGAVCGSVLVSALLFPEYKVFLFFIPIPIAIRKFLKYFIIGSIVLIIGRKLGVVSGNTAHMAHLGGFLGGWLYFKYLLKRDTSGVDIWRWLSNFKASLARRRFVKRSHENGETKFEAKDVDIVLDKISREGIGSLTDAEKAILDAARKNLRK